MLSPKSDKFEKLRSRLELDTSGRLTLNGLQMVLMPRHFFRYIMREVHNAVPPETFRKIYWQAGFDGAVSFCEAFQRSHGCSPHEAVVGYLEEMSVRGWGDFSIQSIHPEDGTMEVLLTHSSLAADSSIPSGNLAWEGAMLGAMVFLQKALSVPYQPAGQVQGREVPDGHHGQAAFSISVTPQRDQEAS